MSAQRWRIPLLASLVVFAAGAGVRRKSPRQMGIVDLLNVPRVADPQLSPDGRSVLFTKSESDWKSGRRILHIWRTTVDGGGQPVQLTSGAEGEASPRWSPDART